jgi:hypothetical protein
MDMYTFRGKRNQRATWARHGRTTRHDRPCKCGRPSRCGRTYPVPRFRSESLPSPRAQLGWTRLIKETSIWSNGWSCDHLDQWVHLSGPSTATTVIPRPPWASLSEGGSSRHRGGSAAPPNLRADRNRLKLPTFNRIRSKDQERPSQEAVDYRADRTYENGPTRSTNLTYL